MARESGDLGSDVVLAIKLNKPALSAPAVWLGPAGAVLAGPKYEASRDGSGLHELRIRDVQMEDLGTYALTVEGVKLAYSFLNAETLAAAHHCT